MGGESDLGPAFNVVTNCHPTVGVDYSWNFSPRGEIRLTRWSTTTPSSQPLPGIDSSGATYTDVVTEMRAAIDSASPR